MLRRIFGPRGVEVTKGWRKLHNEEHSITCTFAEYIQHGQVKEDEMSMTCSTQEVDN